MKAYSTRVGDGALPTEDAQLAQMLHNLGREFGATTGRKRRCGLVRRCGDSLCGHDQRHRRDRDYQLWMDWIRSIRFEFVLATSYTESGSDVPPCDATQPGELRTGLRRSSMAGIRPYTLHVNFRSFPSAARKYVRYISELTGAKTSPMVSVGPARGETICCERRS
jgi:adenylosuccinate synthase